MKECLTHLQTEPLTADREWTVEGIPVLTAVVSLPQPIPATTQITRRILRYYRLQARAFLRYCERSLFPQAEAEYCAALACSAPLPHFRAELTHHITYNENGLWSLYTQSRESTGAGSPLLTRRGDTWDLTTGYPVPLSAFFSPHASWKKQLISLAAEEIQRRKQSGLSLYHETWRKGLRHHFNPQNFYLSPDGLVFFYPMHAIAPAMEGIPAFTVPFPSFNLQLSNS